MSMEEELKGAVQTGPSNYYTKAVDKDGKWIAIHEFHKKPGTDEWCMGGGFVPFKVETEYLTPGSPKWDVVQWEPLTLSPSLLCMVCKNHGWIREGRWVSA